MNARKSQCSGLKKQHVRRMGKESLLPPPPNQKRLRNKTEETKLEYKKMKAIMITVIKNI